jgi:hypothetical protein
MTREELTSGAERKMRENDTGPKVFADTSARRTEKEEKGRR